jgi:hypothetical protein
LAGKLNEGAHFAEVDFIETGTSIRNPRSQLSTLQYSTQTQPSPPFALLLLSVSFPLSTNKTKRDLNSHDSPREIDPHKSRDRREDDHPPSDSPGRPRLLPLPGRLRELLRFLLCRHASGLIVGMVEGVLLHQSRPYRTIQLMTSETEEEGRREDGRKREGSSGKEDAPLSDLDR